MKSFFIQTLKKVSKAVDNFTSFEKGGNCGSIHNAVSFASCKSDLIMANKMSDFLIGLHSNGKINKTSFLTGFYKRKTVQGKEKNDCYFNDFYHKNVFSYLFKNQLY